MDEPENKHSKSRTAFLSVAYFVVFPTLKPKHNSTYSE